MKSGCLRVLLVLFILAALLAVAGYRYRDRLLAMGRERLNRELEEKRLFLDYSVDGDVRFNSVTLRNLTFYRTSSRKESVAVLDHLSLRVPLLASLLGRAPEVIASTQDAKLAVQGEGEPVIWEDLTFEFQRGSTARTLDFRGNSRGFSLDLAARWEVPKSKKPAAPQSATPAPAPAPAPAVPSPQAPSPPVAPPPAPSPEEQVIESKVDVSALIALARVLDYRKSGFQPKVIVRAEGKLSPDGTLGWVLSGDSKSFPSNGSDLHLDASWASTGDGGVNLNEVSLSQGERKAQIRGNYRRADEVFEIAQFESGLDWIGILRDFPPLQPKLARIQTAAPPRITLNGAHCLGEPQKSNLTFAVAGWGLNYQSSADRPPVEIRNLELQGTLREGTVEIPSFQASVANGAVKGEASVSPFLEKPTWRSSIDAQQLALAQLIKTSDKFPAEGTIALSFAGFGASDVKMLQGQGELKVSNGRFVDIDAVAPLLRFLNQFSPVAETGANDQVRGHFTIRDGVLRTEDLVLDVSASQIGVKGQLDLTSKQTNIEARPAFRGGLLSAIAKSIKEIQTLVIEGTGPVDQIEWKLKNSSQIGSVPGAQTQPESGAGQTDPNAPSGSLKEQLKQKAMESLLNGSAEETVNAILRGVKEIRKSRKEGQNSPGTPPN